MRSLPTLVSSAWPDRSVLDARGGFCWWYADLVDGDQALVLIVGWGIPFLPGYASAARAGTPEKPADRPSVTLAVVDRGRLRFWMVQELRALTWELACELGTVRLRPDGFGLDADLQGVLAGRPWSARIAVTGPPRIGTEVDHADHEWNVLTATATGTAVVTTPTWTWSIAGRAYADRNAGTSPLHALSGPWCWGRVALPDQDLIWYAADDQSREVRVGRTTHVGPGPRVTRTRVGRWGQRIPVEVGRFSLRPVDESPFYTRFLATGEVDGARVHGVAEWCVPDRIDRAWFRPLVRMAVGPSVWQPLLAGPARAWWG